MVNISMPAMFREKIALEIVDAAGVKLRLRRDASGETPCSRFPGTKQISWLSTLSATFRPSVRAISRISGFDIAPSGVSARRSCGWRRLKRK